MNWIIHTATLSGTLSCVYEYDKRRNTKRVRKKTEQKKENSEERKKEVKERKKENNFHFF